MSQFGFRNTTPLQKNSISVNGSGAGFKQIVQNQFGNPDKENNYTRIRASFDITKEAAGVKNTFYADKDQGKRVHRDRSASQRANLGMFDPVQE